jgi:hypothetical protein
VSILHRPIDAAIDSGQRPSGAPSSLMAKAIYGHIGKALFHRPTSWRIHGGSVGGTKPPARPPLASQPVFRLNATLNLDCLIWTAASKKIRGAIARTPKFGLHGTTFRHIWISPQMHFVGHRSASCGPARNGGETQTGEHDAVNEKNYKTKS